MRLTNEMRERFLSAVMRSIPFKNPMTPEMAVAEFEKRVKALIPAEVVKMSKKYPGLVAQCSHYIENMPKRPRDPEANVHRQASYHCYVPHFLVDEAKKIDVSDLALAVQAHFTEEFETRKELCNELRGVAYHATTLEELQKALPKLKKFMPVPEPKRVKSMAVAPVGLMNKLANAGLQLGA